MLIMSYDHQPTKSYLYLEKFNIISDILIVALPRMDGAVLTVTCRQLEL